MKLKMKGYATSSKRPPGFSEIQDKKMTPQQEKQIADWNSRQSDEIQIRLIETKDERSVKFSRFCEELSRIAPKVRVVREKNESSEASVIQIGDAVRYHAIPLDAELEPFLDALGMPGKKHADIPGHIQNALDKIDMPVELRVYISLTCPFCPATVKQLLPLAFENKLIRITIADGMLFPEMAQSDNIQSAPTVLLDGRFRWTGSLELEELLEIMTNRDPSDLSAASLERMILEGDAFRLAELMLDKEKIFPAFPDVLAHNLFSVRLGAMAAMEEIAEQNIKLAATVAEPLWEHFQGQGDEIKGDILHILGESGNADIIPRLKTISDGSYNAEIREAATEAIEKILIITDSGEAPAPALRQIRANVQV
ncbi:MAG TPA: hypothetical protein ENK58_00715 [Desulfobacterales bacterium]|nr:hypothetical protein [Desulfobacterales bacterium]